MKQPDSLDIGTKMDVARHRLNVSKEDLDTAHLTFEAGQYRAANNRAYRFQNARIVINSVAL